MQLRQPGEIVALRGMLHQQPWYIQSTLVVKDSPQETALLLLPGAECAAPSGYIHQKHGDQGHWDRWMEILNATWQLEKYRWRTNRFLILLEPGKFYATIYIWNHASNLFQGYYINFQLPFERSQSGFDTFDLELDILIDPTLQWQWKDLAEYQSGIQLGIITPEWVRGIEQAQVGLFECLSKRQYPLDGSWVNWQPDPAWQAPNLPSGWENRGQPAETVPTQPTAPASLVCGRSMTIAPENFHQAEYQGRTIYFCTEFCLETFRADPERFYNAHSRRKDTQPA